MKQFTKLEKARLIRTAQNVNQYVKQKNKLLKQIDALQEQLNEVQGFINMIDQSTVMLTGYGSEDLIEKVKIPTGKTNDKGEPVYLTKYQFIYPDTILPPIDETNEVNI